MKKLILLLFILISGSAICKDFPSFEGINFNFDKTISDLEISANSYKVVSTKEHKVHVFKIIPVGSNSILLCKMKIDAITIGDYKGAKSSEFKVCCNSKNYLDLKKSLNTLANKSQGNACFFDNGAVHFLDKEKEILVTSKTFFEDMEKINKKKK